MQINYKAFYFIAFSFDWFQDAFAFIDLNKFFLVLYSALHSLRDYNPKWSALMSYIFFYVKSRNNNWIRKSKEVKKKSQIQVNSGIKTREFWILSIEIYKLALINLNGMVIGMILKNQQRDKTMSKDLIITWSSPKKPQGYKQFCWNESVCGFSSFLWQFFKVSLDNFMYLKYMRKTG